MDADDSDAANPVGLEGLVDDLDFKVAAEAGNPLQKMPEDSSGDGADRSGQDAEPPV